MHNASSFLDILAYTLYFSGDIVVHLLQEVQECDDLPRRDRRGWKRWERLVQEAFP